MNGCGTPAVADLAPGSAARGCDRSCRRPARQRRVEVLVGLRELEALGALPIAEFPAPTSGLRARAA